MFTELKMVDFTDIKIIKAYKYLQGRILNSEFLGKACTQIICVLHTSSVVTCNFEGNFINTIMRRYTHFQYNRKVHCISK